MHITQPATSAQGRQRRALTRGCHAFASVLGLGPRLSAALMVALSAGLALGVVVGPNMAHAQAHKPTQAQKPTRTSAGIPAPVRKALRQAKLPANALSALVVPLNAAQPAWRYRGASQMNPGSVIKLVTTAAALDLLGADYRWQTHFYTDGVIRDDVLHGNLYVRGGGDPKFVLEHILGAYAHLQYMGVRTIAGDWVLDHSAFAPIDKDPADFDGERLRPYNVQPDGLLVNFKSVILKFQPNRKTGRADVVVEPAMAGLKVPASVRMSQGRCGDWRQKLKADVANPDRFVFKGRYPRACGEREWPIAYIAPERYAAKALLGLWQSIGGRLNGQMREGPVPAGARLLWSAPSLPLQDIIADINKFSNNVMAQQVFLTLGQRPPAPATFEQSRQTIQAWWRQRIDTRNPPPRVDNGSGLSRQTRISADQLGALLRFAAQHPQAQAFVDSLAIAGVDGTVKAMGRDGRTPRSVDNARLKSGTLEGVRALAGYVTNRSGQMVAVVAMLNHERAKQGSPVLQAVVEWAASQP